MPGLLLLAIMLVIAAIPGVWLARYALRLGRSRMAAAWVFAGTVLWCLPITLPMALVIIGLLGIDVFD